MDQTATILQEIGRSIRSLRAARRLTLEDLAGRSGLSLSFLSRVERGRAQTSIANLIRIAAALGSTLHELIGAAAPADDPGYAVFRAEAAGARAVPAGSYRWQAVSAGGPGRSMEANLLQLAGGRPASTRYAHPGEELCYVLEGRVRFTVGEASVLLGPGDAIHLRADIAHTAAAADGDGARLLMVTQRNGQGGAEP